MLRWRLSQKKNQMCPPKEPLLAGLLQPTIGQWWPSMGRKRAILHHFTSIFRQFVTDCTWDVGSPCWGRDHRVHPQHFPSRDAGFRALGWPWASTSVWPKKLRWLKSVFEHGLRPLSYRNAGKNDGKIGWISHSQLGQLEGVSMIPPIIIIGSVYQGNQSPFSILDNENNFKHTYRISLVLGRVHEFHGLKIGSGIESRPVVPITIHTYVSIVNRCVVRTASTFQDRPII